MSDTINRCSKFGYGRRDFIFPLALCLLLSVMISQPLPAGAQATQGTLKQVVVLSRHGVRSTTTTGTADNATEAWPVWVQPADFLTLNGKTLMQVLGQGYWQRYHGQDLLNNPCQGVYVWADNVERTIQTAQALVLGLPVQNCAVPVNWLLSAKTDPLFHPLSGEAADFPEPGSIPGISPTVPGQAADAIVAGMKLQSPGTTTQLSGIMQSLGDNNFQSEFSTLETALQCSQGCVSNVLISIQANADGSAGMSGALAIADDASEAFMLEYGDGWQAGQIAWGKLGADPQTIQTRLTSVLNLHVDAYKLVQRNPIGASMQASNLAYEIVQIFNRTANSAGLCPQPQKPCTPCPHLAEGQGVCPPSTAKLIFLVGHDTNIGTLGGMLSMDWDLSQAQLPTDDMPPGGALIFELWQDATQSSSWWVQVYFITVNLQNFPAPASCLNQPLTCLSIVPVTLPSTCSGPIQNSCTLLQFQGLVNEHSNPYFTFADWGPQFSSPSGARKARPRAIVRKPSGR